MEMEIPITIAAILALLVLSAFFSGSETSLTAASIPRMHTLARQGDHRADLVNALWRRKDRLIGAILLGNNLVNIMASALATGVLIGLFGDAGVAYAMVIMTFLVLVFAEVLPKTYAIHHADRLALKVAPVLRVVVFLLFPITHAVHVLVRATFKLFGVENVRYWEFSEWLLDWYDIANGLFKSVIFGLAIALISCYKGFTCRPGAQGVGRATTEAFVASFVSIVIINLVVDIAKQNEGWLKSQRRGPGPNRRALPEGAAAPSVP